MLWLRAGIASVLSQILDTVLFITISFYGEREIVGLMTGQMIAKITLSILMVPLLVTLLVKLGRKLDRAEQNA
jgi:uncharacterized PurR-regulated membrane protein YhhQ (DUF165 family)